jgi:hypothetical protein
MSLRDSSASRSARGSGSEPYVVYVPDLELYWKRLSAEGAATIADD